MIPPPPTLPQAGAAMAAPRRTAALPEVVG